MRKLYNNVLDAIGNTPCVKIKIDDINFYAKLEYLNPGGSIKDRSALYIIKHAEQNGLLKPGYTIIDASSGNHGIALAMIGAIKNYPVIITVSEKISTEKHDTIRAYGAQTIMCPMTTFLKDELSYHSQAKRLHIQNPHSFMPNQYLNTLNARGHYYSLGPELWQQSNGKISHLIAAAGTGGTISGAGRFLKEQNPKIQIIAVDAQNSYRSTNGSPQPYHVEGMGVDFISPVLDHDVIDQFIAVNDDDAFSMMHTLSKQHGILAGPSSGAVAHAAYEFCKDNQPKCLVAIFGDSGRAYLSKC